MSSPLSSRDAEGVGSFDWVDEEGVEEVGALEAEVASEASAEVSAEAEPEAEAVASPVSSGVLEAETTGTSDEVPLPEVSGASCPVPLMTRGGGAWKTPESLLVPALAETVAFDASGAASAVEVEFEEAIDVTEADAESLADAEAETTASVVEASAAAEEDGSMMGPPARGRMILPKRGWVRRYEGAAAA